MSKSTSYSLGQCDRKFDIFYGDESIKIFGMNCWETIGFPGLYAEPMWFLRIDTANAAGTLGVLGLAPNNDIAGPLYMQTL